VKAGNERRPLKASQRGRLMSASEDIRNLFGKFEGQAQQYQEVSRENQAGEARTRWPLLLSIALDESDRVPDVSDRAARVAGERPVPQAQASRESAPAFRVQNGPARSADAARAAGSGPEAGPDMPPLLRSPLNAPAVHYPPIVTPETSTRHSPDARDFAPAVVPVNHFAPASSTLSVPERGLRADALPAPRASILARTAAATSSPQLMEAAPRSSILGRMFTPAVADEMPAPRAGDRDDAAPRRSRDLQVIFSRLGSGNDRKRDQ
jgi:hypothetical protein